MRYSARHLLEQIQRYRLAISLTDTNNSAHTCLPHLAQKSGYHVVLLGVRHRRVKR
jgi:hypothetical protein